MAKYNVISNEQREKIVRHYAHATQKTCEHMVSKFAGIASAHRRMMMDGDEPREEHVYNYRHYMQAQGIILMQMHRRFGVGFPHHLIDVVKDSRAERLEMYRR